MKKLLLVLCATVALCIGMASCSSVNTVTAKQGWANYSEITIKDFDTVGIVSVETEWVEKVGFLHLTTDTSGSKVTYNALMQKAAELGADDVINVRIDQTKEGKTGIIEKILGGTTTTKYMGTALAIKYKDATPEVNAASGSNKTTTLQECTLSSGSPLDAIKNLLPF